MGLKDDANELKGIFSDLNSKLDETLTKSDLSEGLNKSKDSIFSIVDAAQQLVDHQNKQNSLTSSQLKDLQKKIRRCVAITPIQGTKFTREFKMLR